jgi:hypothetical protein
MYTTNQEIVVARKEHQCTWCGETILKGESYHKWKSVDDSWFTSKMHNECHKAAHDEYTYWGDSQYMPYDNERGRIDG